MGKQERQNFVDAVLGICRFYADTIDSVLSNLSIIIYQLNSLKECLSDSACLSFLKNKFPDIVNFKDVLNLTPRTLKSHYDYFVLLRNKFNKVSGNFFLGIGAYIENGADVSGKYESLKNVFTAIETKYNDLLNVLNSLDKPYHSIFYPALLLLKSEKNFKIEPPETLLVQKKFSTHFKNGLGGDSI